MLASLVGRIKWIGIMRGGGISIGELGKARERYAGQSYIVRRKPYIL